MIVERKKLMILPRVGGEVRRAGDHRFPQYPDDWRDGRRRGGGRVQGIPDKLALSIFMLRSTMFRGATPVHSEEPYGHN